MKKNLKYIFSGCLGGLILISSCSKKLDEAYFNPNAPTRVPVETILPSMIGTFIGSSSAAGSAYGLAGDGLLIGRYIQYWGTYSTAFSPISTSASNQSNYDAMGGTVGVSDNLGSIWAAHYYGMGNNLNKLIQWSEEEGKYDFTGAGWAIRAWSMLEAANEYNHIILRQAFDQSRQVFDYEDQPEIYDSVRAICFRAIDFLNRSDGNQGQNFAAADAFLNGGDKNKWKKFVYGLLARSYGYIIHKNISYADSVIKYATLSCSSNADNITVKFANTGITGTSNYFGPFRGNVGSIRQSNYIADLMSGNIAGGFFGVYDPRAPYLLRETPNQQGGVNPLVYKGIIVWKGSTGLTANDQPQNFWGNVYSSTGAPQKDSGRYIFRNGVEWPLMTASEMQFWVAEANVRKNGMVGNGAALAAYTNGISLNFDMLTSKYEDNIYPTSLRMTPAQKTTYLTNPIIVPATPAGVTLTKIMLQKYIALYAWGIQETWADMRRYHYTNIDPATGAQVYAGFTPPAGTEMYADNGGKFVYRCRMRYNSEYLYDIPSLILIGALNPNNTFVLDYHTKECWFSKP
jgi:SusD/RagB-like outer membrane lipoprotein